MKKVSIAVIGCGRIGQMHAKNIQLHEQTNLVCIYDPNEEFAKKVSNDLNVLAVENVDDIFNNNDIDAVLISSPTNTHIDFIERSLYEINMCICRGRYKNSINIIIVKNIINIFHSKYV